jgi:hypothetical protein
MMRSLAPVFRSFDPNASRCFLFFAVVQHHGVDGADNPLTNTSSVIWHGEAQAADSRVAGEIWLYPSTGCPMNSIYPNAMLEWIRERLP